jgi:hypothetical protein
MSRAELIGYAAAGCVFVTFYMKTMVPLRVAGIVSNVLFIAYAYDLPAYPVLILHLALLPLNIIRLRQMLKPDPADRGGDERRREPGVGQAVQLGPERSRR